MPELTAAQKTALKADIAANANTIPAGRPFAGTAINAMPNSPDANFEIARWYSLLFPAVDFWVWRSSVSKGELVNSVSPDGTTFNWVGNGFITRSVGEQTAWKELFNGTNTVNPSLANVRQAFADIFSGTGNAASNRTHLLAVARRKANNIEKLLATAIGTGTTASPALAGYEGSVTGTQVEDARNS